MSREEIEAKMDQLRSDIADAEWSIENKLANPVRIRQRQKYVKMLRAELEQLKALIPA